LVRLSSVSYSLFYDTGSTRGHGKSPSRLKPSLVFVISSASAWGCFSAHKAVVTAAAIRRVAPQDVNSSVMKADTDIEGLAASMAACWHIQSTVGLTAA
jgi:hypothetical protein